ncbi:MAG: carbon-nitrogen hydrolase family protein [Spirochaetaceae bacterium]|nr:carbon-nitrogen hydrolase family protein [Spirochaetaceae bacterium]
MDTTRVACGQFEARAADKDYNLDRMSGQIGEAAAAGCAVIVLPELIVSGYLAAERIPGQAEPVTGPSVRRMREAAASSGIAVVFGMAEAADDGRLYDSLVVVGADGTVASVYRKLHLFGAETSWASAGHEVPVFDLGGVAATGWICFDTRFPEQARCAAACGAELALVPTAWLGPPAEWELALRARAMDNSMFAAGADIVSFADGLRCRGNSMIVGPHGEVLARAEPDSDAVIWADLDPAAVAHQHQRLALLANRRDDLFGSCTCAPATESCCAPTPYAAGAGIPAGAPGAPAQVPAAAHL